MIDKNKLRKNAENKVLTSQFEKKLKKDFTRRGVSDIMNRHSTRDARENIEN